MEPLILTIEALLNDGRGVARKDRWVILVPFALPGEVVRVHLSRSHKNYSEADVVEILKPSEARVSAPCPLFGQCGGCQYQHLSYPEQLRWKRLHVRDSLERIGRQSVPIEDIVPSPNPYAYRTKLTPHVVFDPEKPPVVGFHSYERKRPLVDVPYCLLATDSINRQLEKERERCRWQWSRGTQQRRRDILLLRDTAEGVVCDPHREVETTVGQNRFRFVAGSFFQNNPSVLEKMGAHVNQVVEEISPDDLLDAYSGVGLFALLLAPKVKRFTGIEGDPRAVRLARKNARLNRISNGTFGVGMAESIFRQIPDGSRTLVVMDPPRQGCSETFLDRLGSFQPSSIVYISCAPDTQARDLRKFLTQYPMYQITSVRPFDMFPQTQHIECVVVLRKQFLHR